MHTPKFYLALALAACCGVQARAQLKSGLLSPNSVGLVFTTSNAFTGKDDLKNGGTTYKDVRTSDYTVNAAQTLHLAENDTATISLNCHTIDLHAGGPANQKAPLPKRLDSIGASIEYVHEIDKRWSLASGLGAASNVAEHDLFRRGWGVDAYVVGVCRRGPNLVGYYGVAYNSLSEDWKFVPVVGCEWTPAPGWTLSLGVPKTAVTYALRSNLTLGLELSGDGGTYYIKEDPRPGATPRSLAGSRLEYTEARLGLSAVWRINNRVAVAGSVGNVVYRDFKYIDRDFRLKSKSLAPFASITLCSSF